MGWSTPSEQGTFAFSRYLQYLATVQGEWEQVAQIWSQAFITCLPFDFGSIIHDEWPLRF